jgi:hypothetical protein
MRSTTFISIALGAYFFSALAHASNGNPSSDCKSLPTPPFPDLRSFVSDGIRPLKDAYLQTNRFELDPLSADLAKLENEVDPPKKRLTLTFSVRGNTDRQRLEQLSSYDLNTRAPFQISWESGGRAIVRNKVPIYVDGKKVNAAEVAEFQISEIRSLSTAQVIDKIKKRTQDPLFVEAYKSGGQNPDDYVPMLAAYLKITAEDDLAGIARAQADAKQYLSRAQQIALVQFVGTEARNRYDHARAGAVGAFANEAPLAGDSNAPPAKRKDPPAPLVNPASIPANRIISNLRTNGDLGVCRDIAPAQAMLLKNFGFKNVYNLLYNSGINHVAVIAQDPDRPNEILHFNYSSLSKGDLRQGSNSLTRGEDYSSHYLIADSDGKIVSQLPSEMGSLMLEGAGANIRTLDVFSYRPSGSIGQLTLANASGKSKTSVFVGQTSAGDQVVGIGNTLSSKKSPEKDVLAVTSTNGFAYQKKEVVAYSNEKVVYDAAHLYSSTSLFVNSRWKELADTKQGNWQSRITTTTTASFDVTAAALNEQKERKKEYREDLERYGGAMEAYQISLAAYPKMKAMYDRDLKDWKRKKEEALAAGESFYESAPSEPYRPSEPMKPNKPSVDVGAMGSARYEVGTEAKYQSNDDRTKIHARVATQLGLGSPDIRTLGSTKQMKLGVFHNVSYVQVDGEHVVIPEKLKMTFDTALGLREFGPQILARAGADLPEKRMKASVGYQGALAKDAFTVAPGMERELFLDFEKKFANSLSLTAAYQQPIGMSWSSGFGQVGAKGSPTEMLKRRKKRSSNPAHR